MTAVFNSSRQATGSLFDLITKSSGLVTDTIDSASLGMDMLHTKVRVAHAAQTQNVDHKIAAAKERDLMVMVKDHTEYMVDLTREVAKDPEYAEAFKKNMERFTSLKP